MGKGDTFCRVPRFLFFLVPLHETLFWSENKKNLLMYLYCTGVLPCERRGFRTEPAAVFISTRFSICRPFFRVARILCRWKNFNVCYIFCVTCFILFFGRKVFHVKCNVKYISFKVYIIYFYDKTIFEKCSTVKCNFFDRCTFWCILYVL